MPKWIALPEKDVSLHIHPKGYKKVDDNRAAERKKRQVNEIKPDAGGGNAEPLPNGGTHAKQVVLNHFAQFIHSVRC